MKRIFMLVLLATAAPANAGIENIKESKTLGANEGVLVTSLTCAPWAKFVQLYRAGTSSLGAFGLYRFSSVASCAKGVKTRPMKAGRYYIGWIAVGQAGVAIDEAHAFSFTIEAGKLNYIGDIAVGGRYPFNLDSAIRQGDERRLIDIRDREAEARSAVAAEYPWLPGRYPFVRALATSSDAMPNAAGDALP